MADRNPTGGGTRVVLQVPADHAPHLRLVFAAARDGAQQDLKAFGDRLRSSARACREEAIYARMLDAVHGTPVAADEELVEVVANLAEAIDRGNEYARVVAEHDALDGVLRQLRGCAADCAGPSSRFDEEPA